MRKHLSLIIFVLSLCNSVAFGQKFVEKLDRSVVAIRTSASTVFVQWRLFGTDPDNIAFNVYRGTTLINGTPITGATNLTDNTALNETYTVKPVVSGVEGVASPAANVLTANYFDIPLTPPAGGTTLPYTVSNNSVTESFPSGQTYTYDANDCSVGDLDGDGEYEIILKWDPTNSRDNSLRGYTGNVYVDAYKLNGARLWRMDLGINVRAGAHYTQFMVYDLDGDGKSEVVLRTSDGTIDGLGNVIGDNTKDYRSSGSNAGLILTGNEFLTVFEGATGKALSTIPYEPARGNVNDWGDNYGNRSDRFLAGVAYLDGVHPSLVMCRGYYTRAVLVAYDWDGTSLTKRWTFDSNTAGNSAYAGQGNHNLSVADVDFDGKDEIVYGACAIDDNGTGLYSTGLKHGDALHVSDMDPTRPGLEVWQVHEESAGYTTAGGEFRDARSGAMIFGTPATGDVGRGIAADIDSRFPGFEMWSTANSDNKLFTNKGVNFATKSLSKNFAIWWDGDRLRELFDNTAISKYEGSSNSFNAIFSPAGCNYNNSTKKNPCLSGDILGDWREELVLRLTDNSALRVFITTATTTTKLYTLMHDPQYRCAIAWQNVAYNQPPHPSFLLADGYEIPKQNIVEVGTTPTTYALNTSAVGSGSLYISPVGVGYVAGSIVRVVAVPKPNNSLISWTGDIVDTNDTIYMTMDAAKSVTATFTTNPFNFNLTTSVQPIGTGTLTKNPSASSFEYNTNVTLTATPSTAYKFVGWSGDLSGVTNPANITITADKIVFANFAQIDSTSIIVEAETATFSNPAGTTVDSNYPGFSGTGFVNTDNATGTYIDIPVNVDSAGSYLIKVYYANGGTSARGYTAAVNGTQIATVAGATTGAWSTWSTETFTAILPAGASTIRFTATTAGGIPNTDKIELIYQSTSPVQENVFSANKFRFVPQQGSIVLYSTINNPLAADVLITDVTGKKVYFGNYEFEAGEHTIDLSVKGLAKGVYLCSVIGETGLTKTLKIIIK